MLLRFFVILLLTANLGLWIWQRQLPAIPTPPNAVPASELSDTEPGTPSIELVMNSGDDSSQCSSFGPLRTPVEQQRAVERIRAFATTVWMRESNAVIERGWWVYLPPGASRTEALKQVEQVAAAGIDDYFVVTSGDMENTVSLGLFSHEANARERLARIQSKGFDAGIGLRRVPEPRYWVEYRLDPQRRDLGRILLRAFPEAVRASIPCPGARS